MSDGLTPQYSLSVGLRKAAGAIGTALVSLLPALLPVILDYFSTPEHVAPVLAVDPRLVALAVPISAAIRFIVNYRKQQKGL